MTLTTTFTLLRQHDACTEGYRKLAKHLGGTKYGADTPIDLLTVLESNGAADAIWTLRATHQPKAALDIARRFALDCATHVLPVFEARYPNDLRPRNAIQAAHDYRAGRITRTKLRAAAYAAADADVAAAYAAAAYAYAAAEDAAAERKWQTDRLGQYLRGENPELLALPERNIA